MSSITDDLKDLLSYLSKIYEKLKYLDDNKFMQETEKYVWPEYLVMLRQGMYSIDILSKFDKFDIIDKIKQYQIIKENKNE